MTQKSFQSLFLVQKVSPEAYFAMMTHTVSQAEKQYIGNPARPEEGGIEETSWIFNG